MPLVNSGALKRACRQQADENCGFLYVERTLDDIRNRYEEDTDVGTLGSLLTSQITEDRLVEALKELKQEESWSEVRRNTVYFRDPYQSPNGNVKIIDDILEEMFSAEPYVRKKDLRSRFEGAGFAITEDDVDFLIDELAERKRVEQSSYGPEDYQKPGANLLKEAEVPPIPELLAREAPEGTVTKSDIETALTMPVNDDIMRDLRQSDYIRQLDDRYLVNREECGDRFARSLVDRVFETGVKEEIEDEDGVVTKQTFDEILREQINEQTDALRVVDTTERFLNQVETEVRSRINLDKQTVDPDEGRQTELLVHEETQNRIVESKAKTVAERVQEEVETWGTIQQTREKDVAPHVNSLNLGPRRREPREYLEEHIVDLTVEILIQEVKQLKSPEEF